MSELLGKLHFWLTFVSVNVVFLVMFRVGMAGLMRRVADPYAYEVFKPLQPLNQIITYGVTGEFEDTFELSVFVRLLNAYLGSLSLAVAPVNESDFGKTLSRKQVLSKLWKDRHLREFDKIEFAQSVAKNIGKDDVPNEILAILRFVDEVAALDHA